MKSQARRTAMKSLSKALQSAHFAFDSIQAALPVRLTSAWLFFYAEIAKSFMRFIAVPLRNTVN
jgi:hypothetical protein